MGFQPLLKFALLFYLGLPAESEGKHEVIITVAASVWLLP
jgi:hypothetical protein